MVAIVLLYGLYSLERKDYQTYLDFIAKEIKTKKYDQVILCGGFTDPKRPTESEASTAKVYLLSQNPSFTSYVLEDQSVTTNQNLEFASRRINKGDKIIVYYDLCRKAKVIWISLHFLLDLKQEKIYQLLIDFAYQKNPHKDFICQNIKVMGFDFPNRSKEELMAQSTASILDVMATTNPKLEELDVTYRKKDFGLS